MAGVTIDDRLLNGVAVSHASKPSSTLEKIAEEFLHHGLLIAVGVNCALFRSIAPI